MPDRDGSTAAEEGDLPEDIRSVAEVAIQVQRLVESERDLQDIWIRGEITGISRYDRHMYFALKEEVDGREHQISGIAFNYARIEMPDDLEDGDEVLVRGDVAVYTPQSKYQVKAREIRAAGMGELYRRFLELKASLEDEGLFDDDRKRPLPALPRTVGIVTSDRGAAVRDVINVARRRFPNVNLLLAASPVQGPDAAPQIADAIERHGAADRADVLIVGRGGGSLEDLWAFNEEVVARAIAGSPIPVVSAVGHETDTTIADLVADARTATPSEAAEMVVPVKEELVEQVEDGRRGLAQRVRDRLQQGRDILEAVMRRTGFMHPHRIVEDREQRLDELRRRLAQGLEGLWTDDREAYLRASTRLAALRPKRLVDEARRDLDDAAKALADGFERLVGDRRSELAERRVALGSLSPHAVLERGYTVVERDGAPVTRAAEVDVGDDLDVRFADGTASTEVTEVET